MVSGEPLEPEDGAIRDPRWLANSDLFANKVVLAPMVRQNSLPFRLICLDMGADLVYTEEIIDFRFKNGSRVENKTMGSVDFLDERGKLVLRTCPKEKGKLVVQLGSCKPDRAFEAAKLLSQDVVAVDFNFGCPKPFSIKGGMGAAMLSKPEEIKALLTKCVQGLDIPVTCKIRVLPDLKATLKLVKLIESCGVAAIAVHGRCRDDRPHHDCKNDYLRAIADSISIPMIANGGSNYIRKHSDILKFKEATRASSVMIARVAQKNPSIFKSNNLMEPIDKIIREFTFVASGHYGKEFVHKFHGARDLRAICHLFDLDVWWLENGYNKTKGCADDNDDDEREVCNLSEQEETATIKFCDE